MQARRQSAPPRLPAREFKVTEQDTLIQIAAKSQEESKAQATAAAARTEAAKATEALGTADTMAGAERKKALALLAAEHDCIQRFHLADVMSGRDGFIARGERRHHSCKMENSTCLRTSIESKRRANSRVEVH